MFAFANFHNNVIIFSVKKHDKIGNIEIFLLFAYTQGNNYYDKILNFWFWCIKWEKCDDRGDIRGDNKGKLIEELEFITLFGEGKLLEWIKLNISLK